VGHWAGIGIAEQVFASPADAECCHQVHAQQCRQICRFQIVIDQMAIRPANGQWEIVPDKIWYKTGDSNQTLKDVF